MRYDVIVGNVGTVYSGPDRGEADRKFATYAEQSRSGRGRAGGERVYLTADDEIIRDNIPTYEPCGEAECDGRTGDDVDPDYYCAGGVPWIEHDGGE